MSVFAAPILFFVTRSPRRSSRKNRLRFRERVSARMRKKKFLISLMVSKEFRRLRTERFNWFSAKEDSSTTIGHHRLVKTENLGPHSDLNYLTELNDRRRFFLPGTRSVSVCGDSPEIFIYRNHEWLTAPKFFGLRWSTERTFIDSFFSSKHNFPTQPSWNRPPLFDWEQVVLKRNEEISHKEKSELVFSEKKITAIEFWKKVKVI